MTRSYLSAIVLTTSKGTAFSSYNSTRGSGAFSAPSYHSGNNSGHFPAVAYPDNRTPVVHPEDSSAAVHQSGIESNPGPTITHSDDRNTALHAHAQNDVTPGAAFQGRPEPITTQKILGLLASDVFPKMKQGSSNQLKMLMDECRRIESAAGNPDLQVSRLECCIDT